MGDHEFKASRSCKRSPCLKTQLIAKWFVFFSLNGSQQWKWGSPEIFPTYQTLLFPTLPFITVATISHTTEAWGAMNQSQAFGLNILLLLPFPFQPMGNTVSLFIFPSYISGGFRALLREGGGSYLKHICHQPLSHYILIPFPF